MRRLRSSSRSMSRSSQLFTPSLAVAPAVTERDHQIVDGIERLGFAPEVRDGSAIWTR